MKWFTVPPILFLVISCGSGLPTYSDRVRPMTQDQAHPLYQQLLPLIEKPGELTTDQLVQTWNAFLEDAPRPLEKDGTFTFVYYDFTHKLDQVFLEATFAPGRLEPMTRVGHSALFVRVYSVPLPSKSHYRFSDGTTPLADPFHPDVESGEELWHPLIVPDSVDPSSQWISGTVEPALEGQDLAVLLPPLYRRNLATSYPLVIVTGQEGRGWIPSIEREMKDGSIRPMIVVSLGSPGALKTVLEDRVVPWVRAHYRASPLASDLILIGWGAAAKATQEAATARPDFWIKTWFPLSDRTRTMDDWNTLAPPFFRAQYPAVAP